eukprot:Tbor_TRINITY_DN2029_c0_g2::TRINITY_DN2029_c0_g2_i1::g.12184::m.12184/K10080/LMAN1, ERGIC53; lectin, mannose-binding 1
MSLKTGSTLSTSVIFAVMITTFLIAEIGGDGSFFVRTVSARYVGKRNIPIKTHRERYNNVLDDDKINYKELQHRDKSSSHEEFHHPNDQYTNEKSHKKEEGNHVINRNPPIDFGGIFPHLRALSRHDPNNVDESGGSLLSGIQKLKHRSIPHHSLIPPHISAVFGARSVSDTIEGIHHTFPPSASGHVEDLPFWTFAGSSVVTNDYVRLTPFELSHTGGLWNLESISDLTAFELQVGIKTHSPGSVGADGIAVWIVDRIPTEKGPLFGHPLHFRGLGILLDSYDNDNDYNNPTISLIYNPDDGSNDDKIYHMDSDFKNENLGSCRLNYRNHKEITTVVLRYSKNGPLSVVVYMNNLMTEIPCIHLDKHHVSFPAYQMTKRDRDDAHRVLSHSRHGENTHLDSGYHIGITAMTGGLADNHDIYYVSTAPGKDYHYDHDVSNISHYKRDSSSLKDDEENGRVREVYARNKDSEEKEYWKKNIHSENDYAVNEDSTKKQEVLEEHNDHGNQRYEEQHQQKQHAQQHYDQQNHQSTPKD